MVPQPGEQKTQKLKLPLMPRMPMIPGITDTDANLRAIVGFLKDCGADKAELLEYHPLWREKNCKLGIPEPASGPEDLPPSICTARHSFLDPSPQLIYVSCGSLNLLLI